MLSSDHLSPCPYSERISDRHLADRSYHSGSLVPLSNRAVTHACLVAVAQQSDQMGQQSATGIAPHSCLQRCSAPFGHMTSPLPKQQSQVPVKGAEADCQCHFLVILYIAERAR